jgi:radical SAM superfamily enzyme YgiQ (UPF0313 family)
MLTLINTNLMRPPIAPIGLDYVASAAREAGLPVEVLDLTLAADPEAALRVHFARREARLVGLSFRNFDDCFWPSGQTFIPRLTETVREVKRLSGAPVVLGGCGYSILARPILEKTGADFGIRGDGEAAMVALWRELDGLRRFERVPGLLWRDGEGEVRANPPAWPDPYSAPTTRREIDNALYFRLGGQGAVETKRGCDRRCTYCADPLAKGPHVRRRRPAEVADEVESLLGQGIDVLHLADCEFNVPGEHAADVCEELIRRCLGERVRWYAYLAVVPFDAALADAMNRAGCVGINFTGDTASDVMLQSYRQPHRREDLARAARLCRERGIAVMIDLLLGGPGETPETAADTISFIKQIDPDCAGTALGIRVLPGTAMEQTIRAEGAMESNPAIRRRYSGPVDLVQPTFYISTALGKRPASLVKQLIGGDPRFFEPADDALAGGTAGDYNYNDNAPLEKAIREGARGAYWHILRKMRS